MNPSHCLWAMLKIFQLITNKKTVMITASDRLSLALENRVWANNYPILYNWLENGTTRFDAMILSEIVWDLLVTYAKLDATDKHSQSRYRLHKLAAWATHVDDGGYDAYDIGVCANGQTVRDILLKIAYLTESKFWIGGAGKLKFLGSLDEVTGQTYEDELISVGIDISLKGRINYINCKYGYDFTDDTFTSDGVGPAIDSTNKEPTAVPYTYQTEYIDDRIVFHNTLTSANLFMLEKLARTDMPIKTFNLITNRLGFIEDIGNEITLTDLYADPASIVVAINEIVFNPNNWTITIRGNSLWVA